MVIETLRQPLFDQLAASERILLAGAGGGFDVFSALPLYFALREAGKHVRLASLSFSYLGGSDAPMVAPALYEVAGDHAHALPYFPEAHLASWLAEAGDGEPIFCFDRRGLKILEEGYRHLVDAHGFDAVALVDGGTDSLMRGDEAGLDTPAEDAMSLLAVDALDVPRKLLACLGFGVDRYHGVCHAQYLEAVAALTVRGAFLGAFALTSEMSAVRRLPRGDGVRSGADRGPREHRVRLGSLGARGRVRRLTSLPADPGDRYDAVDQPADDPLLVLSPRTGGRAPPLRGLATGDDGVLGGRPAHRGVPKDDPPAAVGDDSLLTATARRLSGRGSSSWR